MLSGISRRLTARRPLSLCVSRRLQSSKSPLQAWHDAIRTKTLIETDVITASQFNLMGNTLNHPIYRNARMPDKGTELPPAWHLAYFPPRVPESDLSPDGYEQDWKPLAPFTHRMWAAGELEWNPENPLRVGDVATMESKIRDVQFRPAGRRGDSVFIWVDKKISNERGWCLTESRCWVYLQAQEEEKKDTTTTKKTQDVVQIPEADFTFHLVPTPILLFRFSALTFNSHLIHYDHQYATNVEHHRGCLVHGPLSFTLMVDRLGQHLRRHNDPRCIQSFSYRCRSPLVVNEPLKVQGKAKTDQPDAFDLWVVDAQGNLAVKGVAILGHP